METQELPVVVETITITLAILVMTGMLALMSILLLNMVLEEWDNFKDNLKHVWTKKKK